MPTITKKELVDRIAKKMGVTQSTVKTIIQCFLDEIISELGKGNRLEFRDFGVFEPREHAPRTVQNPKTLKRIHVPSKRVVKFIAGRLMRHKLNRRKAGA